MKLLLTVAALLTLCAPQSVITAEEIETLVFSEYLTPPPGGGIRPIKSQIKNQSVVTTSANIEYMTEVPQAVKNCVHRAVNVWQEHIEGAQPFNIQVYYEPIEENIRAEVYTITGMDGIACPYSLKYWQDRQDGDATARIMADGIIRINSDLEWNSDSEARYADNSFNLVYAVMRAVGRIMGFGSSVRMDPDGTCRFSMKRAYYIYDTFVQTSDNIPLTWVPLKNGRPNDDLTTFVMEEDNVFGISGATGFHKLDPGPFSVFNQPLSCTPRGLMGREFFLRDELTVIDPVTADVLGKLGWKIKEWLKADIECPSLGEDGILPSTLSHKFFLRTDLEGISDARWTLMVPLKGGKIRMIYLKDSGLGCTLPILSQDDWYRYRYEHDGDGLVDCRLIFQGRYGDRVVEPYLLSFLWDLKPYLESPLSLTPPESER